MAFPTEREAFEAYAAAMPNNVVLLVDTYDTLDGVRNAIEVGLALRQRGRRLAGIRLDSGDLAALSIAARAMLDEAGLTDVDIVASNELDEHVVASLKGAGCAHRHLGRGHQARDRRRQPALGGVYKLSAIRRPGELWRPTVKSRSRRRSPPIRGPAGPSLPARRRLARRRHDLRCGVVAFRGRHHRGPRRSDDSHVVPRGHAVRGPSRSGRARGPGGLRPAGAAGCARAHAVAARGVRLARHSLPQPAPVPWASSAPCTTSAPGSSWRRADRRPGHDGKGARCRGPAERLLSGRGARRARRRRGHPVVNAITRRFDLVVATRTGIRPTTARSR